VKGRLAPCASLRVCAGLGLSGDLALGLVSVKRGHHVALRSATRESRPPCREQAPLALPSTDPLHSRSPQEQRRPPMVFQKGNHARR
jgi:hypothetical protein